MIFPVEKRPYEDLRIQPAVGGAGDPSQYYAGVESRERMLPGVSGEAAPRGAWRLSVADDAGWKYQVAAVGSTVQNGTNGDMIDLAALFDTPTAIPGTKYVALKATVSTSLVLSAWGFELYEDRPDEILIEEDGDEVLRQTELRFLIGKITIEGDPETATVEQIATLPQRIVTVFLNGKICKGITSV